MAQTGPSDGSIGAVWHRNELLELVASFLPRNDIACGLRRACKRTAELFKKHTVIKLSQPVPFAAFSETWGHPDALAFESQKRRQQLALLTAGTGAVENMQLLAALGVTITRDVVDAAVKAGSLPMVQLLLPLAARDIDSPSHPQHLETAAAEGHLHICRWLVGAGHGEVQKALAPAARRGQRHVCEWLVAQGCAWTLNDAAIAAETGDPAFLDWALEQLQPHLVQPPPPPAQDERKAARVHWLVNAVASHLDLPTLARVTTRCGAWLGAPAWEPTHDADAAWQLLGCAVASPTPDWRAKAEWCVERWAHLMRPNADGSLPWSARTCPTKITRLDCPAKDAAERLVWLAVRGALQPEDVLPDAAKAGKDLLLFLGILMLGPRVLAFSHMHQVAWDAASSGCAECVRLLRVVRFPITATAYLLAAERGEWALLRAMLYPHEVEVEGAGGDGGDDAVRHEPMHPLTPALFDAAVHSGSLELQRQLLARGCPVTPHAFTVAAATGGVEQLRFLASIGVPLPTNGSPYLAAAANGNTPALHYLAAAGCSWGDPRVTFKTAVHDSRFYYKRCSFRPWMRRQCDLEGLKALRALGCPVRWKAAVGVVPYRRRPRGWSPQQGEVEDGVALAAPEVAPAWQLEARERRARQEAERQEVLAWLLAERVREEVGMRAAVGAGLRWWGQRHGGTASVAVAVEEQRSSGPGPEGRGP